jgi:TetR/AcrR family transcriptional repressor of nem operon
MFSVLLSNRSKATERFLIASDSVTEETDSSFSEILSSDRDWRPVMQPTTKGERTRSRIVAEAAAVFNQHGYEGTSMQDVMNATGLEKGGLYRHFASKEQLAAEAFQYAWSEAMAGRTRDLDNIEGAMPKLRYVVERFVTRRSSVPGGCPLMNMAVEADDGNPVLRGLAHDALHEWQAQLISIIKNGVAAGDIKRGTDARRLANRIIATLEGALMISRLERTRDALVDARAALETELDGIAVTVAPTR